MQAVPILADDILEVAQVHEFDECLMSVGRSEFLVRHAFISLFPTVWKVCGKFIVRRENSIKNSFY